MENLVLEKAFEVLCAGVQDLIVKNFIFKSLLNDAKSRLDDLAPLIKKLAHYNQIMGGQEKELEALKGVLAKGQELVDKCSTITRWSPFKKYNYARKILQWANSLKSPLESVKLKEAMNVMDMRIDVQRMSIDMQRVSIDMQRVMLNQHSGESSSTGTRLELPPLPRHVVGLDAPMKDLKEKLLCDDGESMLVLTAPGGCGKTTLATMFCKDEEVKGKFKNNIVLITVSQKGNLEFVVKRLCQYVGSPVPSFQNEIHMLQWIETFRKERSDPLLLVLDDMWSGQESILERFRFEMSNYKILVTSRSEFSGFGFSYHLKLLDDDNAMELFYHSASLRDERSHTQEGLSRKIVKRCNGFPLAITVVGRSLAWQPLEVWRKRESEWSKGSSILDSEEELFRCLQSSLDALDKGLLLVKDCYLDLGSFPEDYEIPVGVLIDMWAELYDLDDDIVFTYVHELCNRNLATLEDIRCDYLKMEGDDYYGRRFVTQHDLLRELAIYNAKIDPVDQRKRIMLEICGNNIPRWLKEQKYQPTKARLLSITTDGEFSMKWPQIQLPEAEVLVLNFVNFDGYECAIPEFMEKMDKLKVVVIFPDDVCELQNLELLQLLPNLKRISLHNISIRKNPIQLKSLKKISLSSCHLCFEDVGKMSDAFPNIEELNIDSCFVSCGFLADFFNVINLKKISICDCPDLRSLPEEIGNLVNLEVLRLRDCDKLLKFTDSVRNLKKLNFLDLSGCHNIQLPEDIGELSSLRKLDMRGCYKMKKLPPSVADLDQLEEVRCVDSKVGLWEAFRPTLTNLRIERIPWWSG